MSVSVNQIGWQFSRHLLTDRNVENLSPKKMTSYCFSKKTECNFIPNGMAVQLQPYIRLKC